ncbi:hypothetical protein AWV79_17065 [Cupriavidus sp. UYMMa02A]|nr:hypothetical protein AWV79_17065 [Cupriavidus sp. UYMMa02A]
MNISCRTAAPRLRCRRVEQRAERRVPLALFLPQRAQQAVEAAHLTRLDSVLQVFAPFHLLHQERGRHGGVVLRLHVHATQSQQIGGALERLAQRAVGLVGVRGPLHRHAPFGLAGIGKAIRMRLRLHGPVCGVQRRLIHAELHRQAEQRKKIVFQSFPNKKERPRRPLVPSRQPRGRPWSGSCGARAHSAGGSLRSHFRQFTRAPSRSALPCSVDVHGRNCQGGLWRMCCP